MSLIFQLTSEDIKQHYLPITTCGKSAVSLFESGKQRYIKTNINNVHLRPSLISLMVSVDITEAPCLLTSVELIVQELCESGGGRPGLSVLTSLMVSVDVKL